MTKQITAGYSPSYEELNRRLFYVIASEVPEGLMVTYFTYTGSIKSSSYRLFPK